MQNSDVPRSEWYDRTIRGYIVVASLLAAIGGAILATGVV